MKTILLSLVFIATVMYGAAQSGQLDPSFGKNGIVKTDIGTLFNYHNYGNHVLVQPDGSMYFISEAAGETIIMKKKADGSPDIPYGQNGMSVSASVGGFTGVIQTDGKIVIVGNCLNISYSSDNDIALARFNVDGSLDNTFGKNGIQVIDLGDFEGGYKIALQTDGKIIVAGNQYTTGGGSNVGVIIRCNIDGSLDNTFSDDGVQKTGAYYNISALAIQNNGKIIVAANGILLRYNDNGTQDNSFNGNSQHIITEYVNSIAIQKDDKVIICGGSTINGIDYGFTISRFNADGTPDITFSEDGIQTTNLGGSNDVSTSIAIQKDGKIVAGGFTGDGKNNNFVIARYNTDGSADINFSGDGIQITDLASSNDYCNSINIQNDGKILALGTAINGDNYYVAAVRYQTNGTIDNSFGLNGTLVDYVKQGSTFFTSSAIQKDGKIIAAGYSWNGVNYDFVLARYNLNGSLDNTFSTDGLQMTDFGATDDKANAIAIQTDGKILLAGVSNGNFALSRYNVDGSADISFDGDGIQTTDFGTNDFATSIVVQKDGKILTGGTMLARYNADGSIDVSFNENGRIANISNSIALQSDGKIVTVSSFYVNRYNTDGSIDNTFGNWAGLQFLFDSNNSSPSQWSAKSIAIQSNDKIVIGGTYGYDYRGQHDQFAVIRLNSDGTNDDTFNGGNSVNSGVSVISWGTSVLIQPDNKIIVGGYSYNGSSDDFTIARYKEDGSFDNTFGIDGIQTIMVSGSQDRIASITLGFNGLYAVGYGQFPGNFGVVARFLLTEGAPLPVKLNDFTASLQNKSVLLKWQTSSEENLAGFIIQRSVDATNFSSIGFVVARGNSNIELSYSSIDWQPIHGINYYRLKILDADGQFTYTKIISVKIDADMFTLKISPNPAKNILFVLVNGESGKSIFQITDASGRKLNEGIISLTNNTSFSIDINSLPKGIYNLQLYTKNKTETKRFIKE